MSIELFDWRIGKLRRSGTLNFENAPCRKTYPAAFGKMAYTSTPDSTHKMPPQNTISGQKTNLSCNNIPLISFQLQLMPIFMGGDWCGAEFVKDRRCAKWGALIFEKLYYSYAC
jgi:hypothetical protein